MKSAPNTNRYRIVGALPALLLVLFVSPLSPVYAGVVNPKAFAASNQVMDYLAAQRDAGKIISAQQQKIIWGARTDEDAQHVFDITNPQVYPALIGFDMGCVSSLIAANGISMSTVRADMVDTAIDYSNLGALISYSWHQTSPKDVTPDIGGIGSVQAYGSMSNAEFHDVVTPGTALYNRWLAHVDLIAPYLKQLRDAGVPVLWRPYHEMNGAWFWWSVRPAADYQQLWINLYDRLVDYHGLNNLIWVWSPSMITTNVAQFYPGAAYVDISGVDIYTSVASSTYYTDYPTILTGTATGKPYALTECGLFPVAASINSTNYLWFLCWHGIFLDRNWSTTGYPSNPALSDGNTAANVMAFYNQPFTITLDEVNFPRSYEAELVTSRVSGGTKQSPVTWAGTTNDNVFVHDAVGIGDYMEFDVYVPASGTWNIAANVGRLNNRPQVQLSVAGANVGGLTDLYVAGTTPVYTTVNFGTYTFTGGPGIRTLRLTVVGKNASSLGYRTTVDFLTLTKTIAFFSDDFEDINASVWAPDNGTWSVVTDGTFRYAQTSTAAVISSNVPTMGTATNMTVSADVKLTALGTGTPAVSVAFRYVDANNFYTWQLRPTDNQLRLYKVVGGTATQIGSSVAFTPALNTTYNLKVVANGSTLTGYVDGVQRLQVTDSTHASGKIALRVYAAAVRFDNVVVTTP